MLYAEVIIDQKSAKADKFYTYGIPEELFDHVKRGIRVLVPFGLSNRLEIAVVVSIIDQVEGDFQIKDIIDVLDNEPLIDETMIEIAFWMKDEYLSSFNEAVQTVLPPGDFRKVNTYLHYLRDPDDNIAMDKTQKDLFELVRDKKAIELSEVRELLRKSGLSKIIQSLVDNKIIETSFDVLELQTGRKEKFVRRLKDSQEGYKFIGKQAKKQLVVWKALSEKKEVSAKSLMKETDSALSIIRELEKKGLIELFEADIKESPLKRDVEKYHKIELNAEQSNIYTRMISEYGGKFLIHGVTGSGKTEVYLQLAEHMLSLGKDSIILVPEIALTPQTIERFAGRFGSKIAILHSGLSQPERLDQWKRIRNGEFKIVVGARSAVFAPFKNLGLIVIDEEHENTYKSSVNPKYNTYGVAKKRNELEGCTLVLGSATPSIESYFKTKNGELVLLEMQKRATKMQLPHIKVIDMRDELALGNRSILSSDLYEGIKTALGKREQIIIFLNKRGYSSSVVCRSCGYVAKCSQCEVSMTLHKSTGRLRCHYCGNTEPIPNVCPVCGSNYIRGFGIGTEKIEESLNKIFPDANIVRMDSDAIKTKDDYDSILSDVRNGKTDILIGTQMVSKGLDFPNVTLVGIIAADITLNLPDFRSPERTFQLMTQVAGRAGRGSEAGTVILQTYNPDHYSIVHAKNGDYKAFYMDESKLREAFRYPPYLNLSVVTVFGRNKRDVEEYAKAAFNLLKAGYSDYIKLGEIELIGPHTAPIEKLNNNFRQQILLKFGYNVENEVKDILSRVLIFDEDRIRINGIKVSIDIDPNSIL